MPFTVINGDGQYSLDTSGQPGDPDRLHIASSGAFVSSFNPPQTAPGSGSFTLILNGLCFQSGDQVIWNGQNFPTTYVDYNRLTVTVPAAAVANFGIQTFSIKHPGGNIRTFNYPVFPTVSSITPSSVPAGSVPDNQLVTVTVNGAGFAPNIDAVNVGQFNYDYHFVSSTQVTFDLPGSLFDTQGTLTAKLYINATETMGSLTFDPMTINVTAPVAGPTSSVAALPAMERSTSFTVNWSGSDPGGPELASYSVYVSDDGPSRHLRPTRPPCLQPSPR